VLCIDHPDVQQMIPRLSDRRIITYGFSPQADVRADRVVPDKLGSTFDVTVTDRARHRSRKLGPYRLPMLGSHNVQNALAAVAVGVEMEMVDASTGEQIAAAVDRQNLGSGAVIGSVNFSRDEKFAPATEALDGWAARLREFLDSAQELSTEDQRRADASYQPFGGPPSAR
jgi:UDP-N-acetylmuramoylalanine-D-glutamate ligase